MRFSTKQDGGHARDPAQSLCAAKIGHGMVLAADPRTQRGLHIA
jgi:hypothetical protein